MEENQLKTSGEKGIKTVKHVKVSVNLYEKIQAAAANFEEGESDLVRDALIKYFSDEKVELNLVNQDFSDRTIIETVAMDINTGLYLVGVASENNISRDLIAGEILRIFSEKNQIPTYEPPKLESLNNFEFSQEISKMINDYLPESTNYEDFVNDLVKAGIDTKIREKDEVQQFVENTQAAENSSLEKTVENSIISINLNQLDLEDVRESLKIHGFNEMRYYTFLKESQVKAKFDEIFQKKLSEKNEEIGKLKTELITTKSRENSPSNENELIPDFNLFVEATKIIIEKLIGSGSMKNIWFKTTREEILAIFPEKFRKIL